jgi:hypothetical protein
MSAAHRTTPITAAQSAADAVEIFQARCEARAHLYPAGEIDDLRDAVDELPRHAERHGLVVQIGLVAVHRFIAEAFRPVRAGEASS